MNHSVAEKVRKMRQRAKPQCEIEKPVVVKADDSRSLNLRVGCELLAGSGWIRQVLISTPWPLAVLRIGRRSLGITSPIFGAVTTVSWDQVKAVEPTLFGAKVLFSLDDASRELRLYRPFLWSRLTDFARRTNLRLPKES